MGTVYEVTSTGTVEAPIIQGKIDSLTLQPLASSGEGVYIKDDLGATVITVKSGVATLTATSQPLTSAHIFVGNGSNIASDVAMSNDVSIDNTGATTVNSVGASSASDIHSAELAANAATDVNTVSTIVKRDGSGNFSMGELSATHIAISAALADILLTDSGSGASVTFTGTGNASLNVNPSSTLTLQNNIATSSTVIAAGSSSITVTDTSNISFVSTGALLLPTHTTIERAALTPVEGISFYNTDTHEPECYNGSAWVGLANFSFVTIASASVLPDSPNYDNGTAGVGATLTGTSGGFEPLVVDGVTPIFSDLILVKDEITADGTADLSGGFDWNATPQDFFITAVGVNGGLPVDATLTETTNSQAEVITAINDAFAAATPDISAFFEGFAIGTLSVGIRKKSGSFTSFALSTGTPDDALNTLGITAASYSSSSVNGIYLVTTQGDSISVNWVITRNTDSDTPFELRAATTSLVTSGTLNTNKEFIQTATIASIGTDVIAYSQYPTVLVAGTGIVLNQSGQYTTINASSGGGGSFTPQAQATDSTSTSTTSASFVTTATSISFTVADAAHRVKITACGGLRSDSVIAQGAISTLAMNGTDLAPGTSGLAYIGPASATDATEAVPCTMQWIATPGDTSAHTFAVYLRSEDDSGGTNVVWNPFATAVITVEEII